MNLTTPIDLAVSVPNWNSADLKLIASTNADANLCSSPSEAKVSLAYKTYFDLERMTADPALTKSVAGVKRKLKLRLRCRQLFGQSCFLWQHKRLSRKCLAYLSTAADLANAPRYTKTIGADKLPMLRDTGGPWDSIIPIAKELELSGSTLILQGSQADQTTTPFSDIDIVLFGDRSDPNQQRLKTLLDRIVINADLLQHHGVFFYDKSLLDCYSESILPLATLEKSISLGNTSELSFRVLNDRYTPAKTLWSFVGVLRRFLKGSVTMRGAWDWKFKISQFLLLPTLLSAVLGHYIYKGDSFTATASLFSGSAQAAIAELTRVRESWGLITVPNQYVDGMTRVLGRTDIDPAIVPDELASWKNNEFIKNATCLLDESLQLAGLL